MTKLTFVCTPNRPFTNQKLRLQSFYAHSIVGVVLVCQSTVVHLTKAITDAHNDPHVDLVCHLPVLLNDSNQINHYQPQPIYNAR